MVPGFTSFLWVAGFLGVFIEKEECRRIFVKKCGDSRGGIITSWLD
jgi:hypothetical protein